jgi:hypothetical protein
MNVMERPPPHFASINTRKDQVICGFRQFATKDTGAVILQSVMLPVFRNP